MKIRVVKASHPNRWYADKIGEVFEVTGRESDAELTVRHNGADNYYWVSEADFEIVNENKTEAVGMANGIIEQMLAEIARTKDELAELKTKVTALEGAKISVREAGDFGEVHGQFGIPRLIKFAKSPQEIRDDIVAQAKRDVDDLKSEWNVRDDIPGGKLRYIRGQYVCNEEFIVNREKRTVVCLLRWKYDNSLVSKGIAKCDPSDCFNASIGKAIALRRALGLDVPAEYYSAPQPTEVRVGDVVKWGIGEHVYEILEIDGEDYKFRGLNDGWESDFITYEGGILRSSKIIDDSRD